VVIGYVYNVGCDLCNETAASGDYLRQAAA
jgi:hypothetical protein